MEYLGYKCRCTFAGVLGWLVFITAGFILIQILSFPFFCNSETVFLYAILASILLAVCFCHCNSHHLGCERWCGGNSLCSWVGTQSQECVMSVTPGGRAFLVLFLPTAWNLESVLNSPSPGGSFTSHSSFFPYLVDVHQLKSKALFFLYKEAAFYGGIEKGSGQEYLSLPYGCLPLL